MAYEMHGSFRYDHLIQPLVTADLLVVSLDHVGHAIDAKTRAKGASAKSDRADLTFSCKLQTHPAPALIITAQKVRSVRAPFQHGSSWIFDRATQRITEYGLSAPSTPAFRPRSLWSASAARVLLRRSARHSRPEARRLGYRSWGSSA